MTQQPLFDTKPSGGTSAAELRKEYEGLITSRRGAVLRKENREETLRILEINGHTDPREAQELGIACSDIAAIDRRMSEIAAMAPELGW